MKTRRIAPFVVLLAGAALVLAITNPAGAATFTWDGSQSGAPSDSSGTWSGGTNWYYGGSDHPRANANDAAFGAGTSGAYTVTLGASVSPTGIFFNTQGYTIAPDINNQYLLTVGSDGITASASATINAPIGLSAAQAWTVASSQTLTVNSGINGAGGLTAGGGALALNGALSFAGSLVVNSGTVTLAGNNSYGDIHNVAGENGNHSAGNPTIRNGGMLSVSSVGANLPLVPSYCPYQDNVLLQLTAGTLLYTGTGTSDSTLLYTSVGNATVDVASAGANFAFNWTVQGGSLYSFVNRIRG